ncbi:MAG TPA: hypothetical protein VED01_07790 [Burkholderiales bacterium]|nr:hypothetical protein [Burkholderiales bacterium]
MEKEKLLIAPVELTPEIRAQFAALLGAKYDTGGGLCGVRDLLDGCALFEVSRGAELVGHYALKVEQRAHGNEGVIVGAIGADPGGRGRAPLTRHVLPLLEQQFIDARAITIYTRRLGLVRELARQGYTCEGFIMRKRRQGGTA